MKLICLFCLIGMVATRIASSASFRTDINPALLYYQAFNLTPDLSAAERDYLFVDTEWRVQRLPDRVGDLLARYDNQFKLVRQAAHATVPCDWGIDMSAGPATLLPGLARVKGVSVTTRLRVQWHLQNGREADACEDLLAAFALARNASRDGTLISTLVQIASEAINCSTIAANFGRFSPETLNRLDEGMAGPPARRTVAECVSTEKVLFLDWTRNKILELRQQYPGDDAKVMEGIRHVFDDFQGPHEEQNKAWERVIAASAGTSEGMLKLLGDREQIFEQSAPLFSLPYDEFQEQAKLFIEDLEKSANPFLKESAPGFIKSRQREFRIQATLAMVHAAIEYRLHGESGLKSVTDPCGKGPFAFRRFVFEGVDRGFELRSEYNVDKNVAVLIFVEKEGTPFFVDGQKAGQPVPKSAVGK